MFWDIIRARYYQFYWLSSDFTTTYYLLGREADLQRLIIWASRKHLLNPRIAYQNRLAETQLALTRVQQRSPQIWSFAHSCFTVIDWLFPSPRYLRRGSAAAYKYE